MTTIDTATPAAAKQQRSLWQWVDRLTGLFYLLALVAVFAAIKPDAFSVGSATTTIQLSIPLLVVATGMTLCLICGEVDLSVAGVAGLAGSGTTGLEFESSIRGGLSEWGLRYAQDFRPNPLIGRHHRNTREKTSGAVLVRTGAGRKVLGCAARSPGMPFRAPPPESSAHRVRRTPI